ncbi:hypothetical protein [Paludisphaera mucosa]|uniref:Major tail protein n=1 Tax=Paludisphaera mucosa TaxID=3030827 RepID=A0ABT6F786_9BACT|nr:hypothetical protein [Paludisphaera mucosa]MDG3003250.1 hypothetical protein [Paludisphaera mucosa]
MSKGYSGVDGKVLIGAVDCDVMGWSADVGNNTWDSTTTGDAGWDDVSASTSNVKGSFDMLYSSDKPALEPTSATPPGVGVRQGKTVAVLHLNINETDGVELSGAALLTKISIKSQVKGGTILTVSFESKGAWVLPGDA